MTTGSGISSTMSDKGNVRDERYAHFITRFQRRFVELTEGAPLFVTSVGAAASLWERYLAAFPESERQYHNCGACRRFIERYGSLALIVSDGRLKSALWSEDDHYGDETRAFESMRWGVEASRVEGVFLARLEDTGDGITGAWRHLSVRLPRSVIHTGRGATAEQAMAEKREDYKNIARALGEFKVPLLERAVNLLKTESLYRSEKVLGPAEWLLHLARTVHDKRGLRRDNLIWKAIATAPAGFCHPRSSMIGTLLDDLRDGLPFDDAAAKFKAKMHPLQYQRPQAAPAAGTIAQAERLVEQMGIARSLERRFARLEEVQKLWSPQPKVTTGAGVFDHLKAPPYNLRDRLNISAPKSITWVKFHRDVLPNAESIEVMVPGHGSFVGVVTAVHADAPPILQWDREDRRNPFSWYVYVQGSDAYGWGLLSGSWHGCAAVIHQPSMWGDAPSQHGQRAIFVIEGQRDRRNPGLCLFPEMLKSELHGVRSVIEAHSRVAKLQGAEEGTANGLDAVGAVVRVVYGSIVADYKIDRWD